jgi:hypothetical protein
VGLWSFDGLDVTDKVYDRSGQGNHGYFSGGATNTAKVGGKVGQALRFDGVDDSVDISSITGLEPPSGSTSFTWAYWIQTKTVSSSNPIGWSPWRFCTVQYSGDNIGCTVASNIITGVVSTSAVNDGAWHHVVYTHSSANVQNLYVDGRLEDTSTESLDTTAAQEFTIGYRPYGTSFPGALDDVRIYNRALSASEVSDLYTATAGTKVNTSQNVVSGSSLQSGLVGLWSFNGLDVTDKVYDRSGQNNHGYFSGGATNTAKTGGKAGQALRFDGNDEIEVQNESNFDFERTQPFSVSAWAYRSDMNSYDQLISKKEPSGNFQGWQISADDSVPHVRFLISDTTGGAINVKTPEFVDPREWHHLVVTYSGNSTAAGVHIYVDNIDETLTVDSDSLSSSILNNQRVVIGNNPASGGGNWNGTLDEVRIYNRVLTPAEVKLLYNLGR